MRFNLDEQLLKIQGVLYDDIFIKVPILIHIPLRSTIPLYQIQDLG